LVRRSDRPTIKATRRNPTMKLTTVTHISVDGVMQGRSVTVDNA